MSSEVNDVRMYFIAGEASGDLIGSRVISSIKEQVLRHDLEKSILQCHSRAGGNRGKLDIQNTNLLCDKHILDSCFRRNDKEEDENGIGKCRNDTEKYGNKVEVQAFQRHTIMSEEVQGRDILFYGVGGSKMAEEGVESLFDIQAISLMGFFEILPHIFRLKALIKKTVDDIIAKNVDVLVTIDCPGFSFRVARRVKILAPHIKLVHIVAPSVWAYKPGRAKKYAKVYDKLLTLLPFEPPYFTKYGLDTECIGHPVLEQKFLTDSKEVLRKEFSIADDCKVIVITPGSRKGEVIRHMPVIREVLDIIAKDTKIMAIFVQPNEALRADITKYLSDTKNFKFQISTERLKSFAVADVALAKSGTNTIEIAASKVPMVVGYKLNPLTFLVISKLIKVKYASVINIMANKEVIPEYLQSDFTADNVASRLLSLLDNKNGKGAEQVARSMEILRSMGLNDEASGGASKKAAQVILKLLFS